MSWILCAILLAASLQDLKQREVSDWFPISLLAAVAVVLILRGGNAVGDQLPPGWLLTVLGLLSGSCVGALLFFRAQFGGGDAKLIAVIGACVGPVGLLVVLAWMALAGLVLSVVAVMRHKKEIAYVPAIAFGTIVYVTEPGLLARMMGF